MQMYEVVTGERLPAVGIGRAGSHGP